LSEGRELAEKRRADLLAVSFDAPLDPADPDLTLLDTLDAAALPGAHAARARPSSSRRPPAPRPQPEPHSPRATEAS